VPILNVEEKTLSKLEPSHHSILLTVKIHNKGGSILSRRIFASLVPSTKKGAKKKETHHIMKSKTEIVKTMLYSFFSTL